MFQHDHRAVHVQETLEEQRGLFVADAQPAETLKPRYRAFDRPAAFVSA